MNKIIIIIFFLSISFVSAIKISPTQQSLKINQYETNCTNIWILPEETYLIGSWWSNDERENLSKYVLNPEKIKLKINYSYISNGKYNFCFTPNQEGSFFGIIYFYSKKSMLEIGTLVELDVENKNLIKKISLITGNTIADKDSQIDFLLTIIILLLLGLLYFILKRLIFSRKNKNS